MLLKNNKIKAKSLLRLKFLSYSYISHTNTFTKEIKFPVEAHFWLDELFYYIDQGFPTWGTRPNRGTREVCRGDASLFGLVPLYSKTLCVLIWFTLGGTQLLYYKIILRGTVKEKDWEPLT
jgi:hypothetical protein